MAELDELLRGWRLPSLSTLTLYAFTLIAELPVLFARAFILYTIALVWLVVNGEIPPHPPDAWVQIALIPTAWSLFALATALGGGWWWQTNLGGREPSEREQAAYTDALHTLQAHTPTPLRLPRLWFVLDEPHPDAAVCGDALMLSRGLLENEYLPAVLAHELGHIATSDGKLTAAINRLIINPLPRTREHKQPRGNIVILGGSRLLLSITLFGALIWLGWRLLRFAQGGLGLRYFGGAWGHYWREREYLADQHAIALGQGEELADFLEVHALIHDHPVPFIWATEHTHPPVELRIDRLRKTSQPPRPQPLEPGPHQEHNDQHDDEHDGPDLAA
jgi:Zn-dependent protease with chaperone function